MSKCTFMQLINNILKQWWKQISNTNFLCKSSQNDSIQIHIIFLITERDDGFENFYAKKYGMCSCYFSNIWIDKYYEVLLQAAVQWTIFK